MTFAWAELLDELIAGRDLTLERAHDALAAILAGEATPGQIGGFLVALSAKGVTADELCGVVRAMLESAEPVTVAPDAIDTCGTGGSDQRRHAAFNVSTIAALVVAGAGGKVCKHGNRRASATSGSADVLEALGVVIDLDAAGVAACVDVLRTPA